MRRRRLPKQSPRPPQQPTSRDRYDTYAPLGRTSAFGLPASADTIDLDAFNDNDAFRPTTNANSFHSQSALFQVAPFHSNFSPTVSSPRLPVHNLNTFPTQRQTVFDDDDGYGPIPVAHNPPLMSRPPSQSNRVSMYSPPIEEPVHEPLAPARYRSIFKYPVFNAVQSECFDHAFKGSDNLVISGTQTFGLLNVMYVLAPTGSGKTVVMELTILQQLLSPRSDPTHIVYVAPTKALCSEREKDWSSKFKSIGVDCFEVTGDVDTSFRFSPSKSSIIVTTPEKWENVTRRTRMAHSIHLFLMDEVHMLNESRGATLEVIVSRIQRWSRHDPIRIIAISATIPNIGDIAEWLSVDTKKAHVLSFDESYRPVQLYKQVLAFPMNNMNPHQFDASLNQKLTPIIDQYSNEKPVLVFCPTRNSTTQAAQYLSKQCPAPGKPTHRFVKSPAQLTYLSKIQSRLHNATLRDTITHGIGFHSAALDAHDRDLIEKAFIATHLRVLFTTSTLASGVNLPAHLVIIKSTQMYIDGKSQEYSSLDMLQMLGRAGRPQFDQSGTAVIITTEDKKEKYESLTTGTEVIESSLHENLSGYLNTELALGVVTDVQTAVAWLKTTFLYVRLKKNPGYYRVLTGVDQANIEKSLETLCRGTIEMLEKIALVKTFPNGQISATEFGRIMARNYLTYETMREISLITQKASIQDVFGAICRAKEYGEARFQSGDKGILNDLNKHHDIMFSIKGRVKEVEDKISLLIQAQLGCIRIQTYNLEAEARRCLIAAIRVSHAIIDTAVIWKDAVILRNAIKLNQSFQAQCWFNSQLVLRQMENIGPSFALQLSRAGIKSFDTLLESESHRIEHILKRNPPFGKKLIDDAKTFPSIELKMSQLTMYGNTENANSNVELVVNLRLKNSSGIVAKSYKHRAVMIAVLLYSSGGQFLEFRKVPVSKLSDGAPFTFTARSTMLLPGETVKCWATVMNIVGINVESEVSPILPENSFETKENVRNTNSEYQFDDDHLFENLDLTSPQLNATLSAKAGSVLSKSPFFEKNDAPTEEIAGTGKISAPMPIPTDNKCNHSCKNKQTCGHLCCKTGRVNPPKRKSLKQAPSVTDVSIRVASNKHFNAHESQTLYSVNPSKNPVIPGTSIDENPYKTDMGTATNNQIENRPNDDLFESLDSLSDLMFGIDDERVEVSPPPTSFNPPKRPKYVLHRFEEDILGFNEENEDELPSVDTVLGISETRAGALPSDSTNNTLKTSKTPSVNRSTTRVSLPTPATMVGMNTKTNESDSNRTVMGRHKDPVKEVLQTPTTLIDSPGHVDAESSQTKTHKPSLKKENSKVPKLDSFMFEYNNMRDDDVAVQVNEGVNEKEKPTGTFSSRNTLKSTPTSKPGGFTSFKRKHDATTDSQIVDVVSFLMEDI